MISLNNQVIIFLLKIYVAIVLVTAAFFSPLALSFVPVLLLAGYLYLWRWPVSSVITLLSEFFIFFALSLLMVSPVGPFFSLLIALPVLLLVHHSLGAAAESVTHRASRHVRRPTDLALTLLLIATVAPGIGFLLGSLSLLLTGAVSIIYLVILGILIHQGLPSKPVEETPVQQRIVAGTENHCSIKLTAKTKIGGRLFVGSPYEWLKVSSVVLSLKQGQLALKVSLAPTLSGPSLVRLNGYATDRWGLIQVRFEMEVIRLYVIPRARYAAWLAKRYLAGTQAGTLPLLSNIAALKPLYGLRSGVEYYGSQLYQPGDSLKTIDWKHSLRYNELITKEFTEFHGHSAIILVNLAVGNAEEADTLAYKIIVTAISLAQEGIPAALAVYNHEEVRLTTGVLPPQQLLRRSLQVAQEIVTLINPVKYLSPPDVARLRANISRLRFAESKAAGVLVQLLQLEYKSLSDKAKVNPATRALSEVLTKVDRQSNIVIVSQRNHDAEALAFNTFTFARRGNTIISAEQ